MKMGLAEKLAGFECFFGGQAAEKTLKKHFGIDT